MSDKALENAKALKMQANLEIERLEGELRMWRDRITRADQFIDQWNAFATADPVNLGEIVSPEQNKTASSSDSGKRAVGNSSKEEVLEAALQIISERGKPIQREDLFEALVGRGLIIQGKDPQMVLSTMLWRMKDFIVRIPKHGYWPKDKPYDAVAYHPQLPYPGDQESSDMEIRELSGTLPEID